MLRWLRHLFWMPPGYLPGEVFQVGPIERRPRGRSRSRWRDYASVALEQPEELEEVCVDGEVWAFLLKLLPP